MLQTGETYLGSARAQNYAGDTPLTEGVETLPVPASPPADEFSLSGGWAITKESITAMSDAGIELNFIASHVFLDVGGTGTVTATVAGASTTYQISGAPNIYSLVDQPAPGRDTLQINLSPGLTAYSFTFG